MYHMCLQRTRLNLHILLKFMCVAVCCSALLCIAVYHMCLRRTRLNLHILPKFVCVAVCCSVSQCIAVYHMCLRRTRLNSHILPKFVCVAVCRSMLQCTTCAYGEHVWTRTCSWSFCSTFSIWGHAEWLLLPYPASLDSPAISLRVCSSVLQCVAICCSVWQCVAVCCSVLQCVAVCCSVLHCVQCVAVCCIMFISTVYHSPLVGPAVSPVYVLQCIAVRYIV